MTNIKITALTDIGNNIAPTTLIPVVDMAGPSTTKKSTLQNAGNLILGGAGLSNFVPAARAILAQSVTNAAQPNITSTGTLTSLTVSGNVNLGSVNNLAITGGTSGQVLSTNGNGVLSWVNDANSSYGDNNVVSLMASFGSNTISTTGLITGDGGGLSNVPYANITGTPTLGNVSAINLDGNVSNVLRGDGTFAATSGSYGDSNVATYLPTYGGNILVDSVVGNTTDNLGYMRWVGNSSGDGNGYTTIEVIPDDTLVGSNQYLIIDPTVPTHIHIRAGGNIDNSSAELYLGGEKNYVRVTDTSGVRLQNEHRSRTIYSFTDPTDFNTATWFESEGEYFVQYTAVDPLLDTLPYEFGSDIDNRLGVFYNDETGELLTYGGIVSDLGGGVYRVSVVEPPPISPTALTGLEYQIWAFNTNSVQLQNNDFTVEVTDDISITGNDFTVEVTDDIRITGNDTFSLRNRSETAPITLRTDYFGSDYVWEFSADGILTLPNEGVIRSNDDTVILESYDTFNNVSKGIRLGTNGSLYFENAGDAWLTIDNVSNNAVLTAAANSYVRIASNNGSENWYFESDGNLTLSGNTVAINFANGTPAFGNIVSVNLDGNVSNVLRGDGTFAADAVSSYGDSNVTSLLETFGSNSITTTGNIGLGNLVFSNTQVQTSAYAGGNGHAMMIDTNRTDTYEANGSADKPFKTFMAAAEAVADLNPGGTVPYTFVLMGCNVNETVDLSTYNFNFITIAATCRAVFNDPVIIGNSALKQLVVRNVEFADTLTITGDGTAEQLNNTSFYNATFSGALTVTAANALAFYEAAFFGTVTFNNIAYLYVNGAQFNEDWTIRSDDTGAYPIPANGIAPGVSILLDFIANNIIFVKGGTGAYVFQPHSSRMGRNAGTYTLPAGWILTAYSSVFIGTWTNSGTWTMRNSSSVNAIAGTAPVYSGIIGGRQITTGPTALTNLTAIAGSRAFINNGNLVAAGNFGAQVGGGGANIVPVYSDGTNWYIG